MNDPTAEPRTPSTLWSAITLLLLAGCVEQPTETQWQGFHFQATKQVARTGRQVIDQFTVAIHAAGQFKPGQPITISVDAVSHLEATAAELRVTMPEVESARASGWSETFSYRANEKLPATRLTRRPLVRGETLGESFEITIPMPGYYHVLATVTNKGAPVPLHEGRLVQGIAVAELWLLVTESGGTSTPNFDVNRIPSGMRPQPGPFRPAFRTRGEPAAQNIDKAHGPNASAATASSNITYQLLYMDADSSTYRPLAGATGVLEWCAKLPEQIICDESSDWYLDVISTSSEGYFSFPCDGDEFVIEFRTVANSFRVNGGVVQDLGAIDEHCDQTLELPIQANPAHLFANINHTIANATNLFSATRPFIEIYIFLDSIHGTANSHYHQTNDALYINISSIWEGSIKLGTFVSAHEYGHAFHEKALDENEGSGSCPPSGHALGRESNLQCAFSEGFADYFAVYVRPDVPNYIYRDLIEANEFFPGCDAQCANESHEGSLIEGAFAAFLYDLTDAVVEAHDSISAPGSYMRDLMRSCKVTYQGSSQRRANGTDEIVYCAENQINPGQYFTIRGSTPSSYAETATESGGWTSARVRLNWIWNMYEKGSL